MAWLDLRGMASRIDMAGAAGAGPGQGWAELIAARDAWKAAILASGAGRVALHFADTFEFAGALLGAWAAGVTAVLPGDATALTVANLRAHADAFAGEFPASAGPRIVPAANPGPAAIRPFPAVPLILFTSGSTGAPVAVAKAADDLDGELRNLDATLGAGIRAERVIATVSHQHIYGLLFRCLWPLACGRPFAGGLIRFPEELAEQLARPGAAVLAASPAFLKRLPASAALENLARHPAAVFSSGGPLPWEAADACTRLFGDCPVEIYGSTETGGIAWRRRREDDQAWTPFPGVAPAIGPEGALSLEASPHVRGPFPMPTADRARLEGGALRLLGRGDRIVKLEEKRLSLSAMEALLAEHPRVAEAKLIILSGERETLGAVLRLRDGSLPVRGSQDRERLVRDLKDHLAGGFERVLHPKRWRVVAAMPANAAGKTAQADLAALFEPQYGPVIARESRTASGGLALHLDIHPELEHFRGHFPEAAILPGVVQLDWAIREGARRFGPFGDFLGLRALKFQRPIVPGMDITLELTHLPAKGALAFAYLSAAGRHASGQAIFAI